MAMYLERLEDLSIVYWLKDKFSGTSFIEVVDAEQDAELVIPSISVDWEVTEATELQLGDRSGSRLRTWFIDVYAKNKSQRDEIAYKIYNDLKDGILVYDYNESFPSTTVIGHLNILKRRIRKIRIDSELVSKMYYRAQLSILAENDIIQED